jgi:predicted 2-oxoglutarate/Fe(II)-dependent dioxygenase YbiX
VPGLFPLHALLAGRELMSFTLVDNDGSLANSDPEVFDIRPSCFEERPFFAEAIYSQEECAEIVASLVDEGVAPSRMVGPDSDDSYVDQSVRSSRQLNAAPDLMASVFARIDEAVDKASRAFGIEPPSPPRRAEQDLLLYGPGVGFGAHADNCRLGRHEGKPVWRVALPHRKLSAVLWLSTGGEDFQGGEFRFLNIARSGDADGVCLRPRAGVLLVFPSHPWYRHQVLPIIEGRRISFVGWYTL